MRFLFILFSYQAANASFYCGDFVKKPVYLKALKTLKRIEGSYTLGRCHIEVYTCENESASNGESNLAAEMLIRRKNKEIYIPIYFPTRTAVGLHTLLKISSRTLYYRYKFSEKWMVRRHRQKRDLKLKIRFGSDGTIKRLGAHYRQALLGNRSVRKREWKALNCF